jgi:hypothetical protein
MADNFFKSSFGASGSGKDGSQGTQGVQGVLGIVGSQGIQGRQGIDGGQGTQGVQGNTEIQGIQGIAGIGTNGFQGIQGFSGNLASSYVLGNFTQPAVQRTNKSCDNTLAASTYLANTLYFHYWGTAIDYTINTITFNAAPTTLGTKIRFLIYDNNNGIGRPNNLLYESVDVTTTSTGNTLYTIILPQPFTFMAGTPYFIGWYADGNFSASSNRLMYNWDSSYNSVTQATQTTNMGTTNVASTPVTFGSAPNPFGNPPVTLRSSTPFAISIWFKI